VLYNYDICSNSCIKIINLYYEISYVTMLHKTLFCLYRWKSLYVSLGSHRYGNLEGDLTYVPVMDSKIRS
jgi:hypothetical protein